MANLELVGGNADYEPAYQDFLVLNTWAETMSTIRYLLFFMNLGVCGGVCFAKFEPAPVGIVEAISPTDDALVRAFPKTSPGGPNTIVFQRTAEGIREAWRINEFFEWVRVSTQGKVVAVIGWRSIPKESTPVLRLEFYSRGKLVRSYALQDLFLSKKKYDELEFMSDLSGPRALLAVEASRPNDFSGSGADFHLVVGDRTEYDFDGVSAKIKNVSYDVRAKSLKDEVENEDQQQIKRALAAVAVMPRMRAMLGLGTIRSIWLEPTAGGNAQNAAKLCVVIRLSSVPTPWVDVVVQTTTDEGESAAVQAGEVEDVVQKLMGNRGIKDLVERKVICGISVTMKPDPATDPAVSNDRIASVLEKHGIEHRNAGQVRMLGLSMNDGNVNTFYYFDSADLLFSGE
jgi:hypothetical protein